MAGVDLREVLDDIGSLVEIETPSGDHAGLRRSATLIGEMMHSRLGCAPEVVESAAGPVVHWRGGGDPRVVILGHHDTVHACGSIGRNPFVVDGDIARGPGILDMKAGLVIALHALGSLADLSGVEFLISADEEVGSAASRDLIVDRACAAGSVLVLEPAAEGGALKTGRKGTGTFVVTAIGRAAHAGLEPDKGVNAVLALAEVIGRVADLADPRRGTTVAPTLIAGGSADNVIPEAARCSVDVRVESDDERRRIEESMRALATSLPGASIEVAGGVGRPPMPESASRDLFALAVEVGESIGQHLSGLVVGGGSDGNFTAAAGVATLDGLGAVGSGAHTPSEMIDVSSLVPRVRLLAGLVQRLSSMERMPPLSSTPADR